MALQAGVGVVCAIECATMVPRGSHHSTELPTPQAAVAEHPGHYMHHGSAVQMPAPTELASLGVKCPTPLLFEQWQRPNQEAASAVTMAIAAIPQSSGRVWVSRVTSSPDISPPRLRSTVLRI